MKGTTSGTQSGDAAMEKPGCGCADVHDENAHLGEKILDLEAEIRRLRKKIDHLENELAESKRSK